MLENVHSTRFKREFCKPATKSDSKTTPEKGLVYFRDGDDCDGNDISNLKPLKLKNINGTNLKMKVVAFYVSILHVYWNIFGEDIE